MTSKGESVFYSATDGLKLHAVDYGRENTGTLPVVCLSGLSRNARDFAGLAEYLSEKADRKRRVICFDYRGRGLSEWDRDWKNYNVMTEAGDVLAGMTALGIDHAAIVGTSRGGLIAMVLAGLRPAAMHAVVLNDVGPVIQADGLVQIRAHLSRLPAPKSWDEAIALQKTTMGKAFPAFTDAEWEFDARARYRQFGKKIRPDHDPALVKTLTAIDLGASLPTLWPQFAGLSALPLLLLHGEHSSLLLADTVDEMAQRHETMQRVEIAGQGHAPMLHTAGIPQTIETFLDGA